MKGKILSAMADKWGSAVVSRDHIGKFTGGLISPGTMMNREKELDRKFKIKRKVFYYVDDVLAWLAPQIEEISNNHPKEAAK